jgi:hypothetical protein
MCDIQRPQKMMATNQHDVEMMKVFMGVIPPLLQALTAPIIHNHYHHQTNEEVGSNPYRSAKTVNDLEKILLSHPRSPERDKVLKHLAGFPESMPMDRVPMQQPKLKMIG